FDIVLLCRQSFDGTPLGCGKTASKIFRRLCLRPDWGNGALVASPVWELAALVPFFKGRQIRLVIGRGRIRPQGYANIRHLLRNLMSTRFASSSATRRGRRVRDRTASGSGWAATVQREAKLYPLPRPVRRRSFPKSSTAAPRCRPRT